MPILFGIADPLLFESANHRFNRALCSRYVKNGLEPLMYSCVGMFAKLIWRLLEKLLRLDLQHFEYAEQRKQLKISFLRIDHSSQCLLVNFRGLGNFVLSHRGFIDQSAQPPANPPNSSRMPAESRFGLMSLKFHNGLRLTAARPIQQ